MKAVLAYAGAAAILLSGLAAAGAAAIPAAEPKGLWLAAAVRFAAVGVVAVWLTQAERYDPATVLVGMVAFIFVLVLLEPLFLRLAD